MAEPLFKANPVEYVSNEESLWGSSSRGATTGSALVPTVSSWSVGHGWEADSRTVYRLGFDNGRTYCACPALGRCSHLIALLLVTLIDGT